MMTEVMTVNGPPQKELRPLAYSIAQVRGITSLSLRKINGMIADGRLKSVKIDGRRLIYASSVQALLPDEVA